jgi:hypothetical protein
LRGDSFFFCFDERFPDSINREFREEIQILKFLLFLAAAMLSGVANAGSRSCVKTLFGPWTAPRTQVFSQFTVDTAAGRLLLPQALSASPRVAPALRDFFSDSRHNAFLDEFRLTEELAAQWKPDRSNRNVRDAIFWFGPPTLEAESGKSIETPGCIRLTVRIHDGWLGSNLEFYLYAKNDYSKDSWSGFGYRRFNQLSRFIPPYSDGRFVYRQSYDEEKFERRIHPNLIFQPIVQMFTGSPSIISSLGRPDIRTDYLISSRESANRMTAVLRVKATDPKKMRIALDFLKELRWNLTVLGQGLVELVDAEPSTVPLYLPADPMQGLPEVAEGTYSLFRKS